MADRQARGAAGEAPVGEQGALLAQAFRLQVARRVQHFLHARPAFRAFVADHHHVAGLHLVAEDAGHRRVLAFVDTRRAFEHMHGFVHARGLHHAAIGRDVAREHRESTFPRIRMRDAADAAFGAIRIQ